MKGLTYCWFVSNKSYFAVAAIVLAVTLAVVLGVMPALDFIDISLKNLITAVLGLAIMAIPAESLGKDAERCIKSRFTDYSLSAMSRTSFINSLLIRNLICLGLSVISGFIVLISFVLSTKTPLTAELIMIVPCGALMMCGIDFLCTPLTIKLKSADKAGLALGAGLGVLMMIFVITYNTILGNEDFKDMLATLDFSLAAELVFMGVFAAVYLIGYILTAITVKRGDVC